MIPSMISPLEESQVPPPSRVAEYAAPATPALETVLESPGYTVPEDSAFTWIPGFVHVLEAILEEEGGHTLSLEQPPPLPVPTSAATPVVMTVATEPFIPTMPLTPDDRRNDSSTGSVRQTDRAKVFVVDATEGSTSSAMCQGAQDIGPDLTREGPFDACEDEPEPGQSPLVLSSMPGCQFRMTSYDDRDNRNDLDPAYGIHLHDPRMMEYMGAPESARLLGRSPEYWLEHICRDRAVSAALRLHHDVSVCNQFEQDGVGSYACSICQRTFPDTTWPQWACGALLVLRYFLDPSRSPPATTAWPVRTAFQMLLSDELTTSKAV